MNWHLTAWNANLSLANNQTTALVDDTVLQRRNSNLILSEPYNLLAAYAIGVDMTRARFNNVALTTRGVPHLWPITRSATVVSRPRITDLRDMPLKLPVNEEIIMEVSQDGPAMGTSQSSVVAWVGKPDFKRNIPRGHMFRVRATVVITAGAENAFTALATPVMERDLFGGVYSVVGAHLVAANGIAFRMFFPRQPCIEGRQHRPGGLVQNAIGDHPWEAQDMGFGEWGRFHTFEPPQVQVLSDAAGGTYELRLNVVFLGEDQSLLRV